MHINSCWVNILYKAKNVSECTFFLFFFLDGANVNIGLRGGKGKISYGSEAQHFLISTSPAVFFSRLQSETVSRFINASLNRCSQ